MASLSLKNVTKKYPNGFVAVKEFNLEIADKEFIIFVGPSGCGKSTTLRMIAGLEDISSGELYIDDKLVNDVEPKDRDIAMVFQNYALYPHMSVYDNMAFGLKLRKTPKDEIDKKVHDAAKILDLEHLLDRKPKALSGGQRQRVAMGRAIVRNPKVFLMDEPLSNLHQPCQSRYNQSGRIQSCSSCCCHTYYPPIISHKYLPASLRQSDHVSAFHGRYCMFGIDFKNTFLILCFPGFPGLPALCKNPLHFFPGKLLPLYAYDFQYAFRNINPDKVILFHQCNGPPVRCLR